MDSLIKKDILIFQHANSGSLDKVLLCLRLINRLGG